MSANVYQAIVTKYIGPSNYHGSRIKATAAAGSITIHYDDSLNSERAHAKAAEALARKFKWEGNFYQGGMPNDSGYCFVNVSQYFSDNAPAFVIEKEAAA